MCSIVAAADDQMLDLWYWQQNSLLKAPLQILPLEEYDVL